MSRPLVFAVRECDELRLLELDERWLEDIACGGAVIKASAPDDKVVLCTSDRTFSLKSVETSNSVFLVNDAANLAKSGVGTGAEAGSALTQMENADEADKIEVCAIKGEHWEIEQIAPDLSALVDILSRHAYGASDDARSSDDIGSADEGASGCSLGELLEGVQASEAEVVAALRDRNALLLDGRWYSVEEDFSAAMIDVLVSKVSENGWPLHAIPIVPALDAMAAEDFRRELALHCIQTFGTGPASLDAIGSQVTGSLDPVRVCRHYAQRLLRATPKWRLASFLDQWQSTVPVGVEPRPEMLDGLVLYDRGAGDITYMPGLPEQPSRRFDVLFSHRERWHAEDLRKFVGGMVVPPGKDVEAVIEEHLHAYQSAGVTMYRLKDCFA